MSSKSKTGKMIIKPGKLSYTILKWMQEHDGQLKKTTGHQIAEKITALDDVESGTITIEQVFAKMIACNIVYRERYPHKIWSDYRINYWHKSIPADVLEDAPVSVKRAMAERIDSMTDNQYMDEDGCVVTPNAVEKTEDPFNEASQAAMEASSKYCGKTLCEVYEPGTFENPIVEEKDPWEEEPKEETTTLPLHITKTKDGKTTNVTINLTINI